MYPCLWRAPTDNDEGGGTRSLAASWRAAGLHRLAAVGAPTLVAVAAHEPGAAACVELSWRLAPSGFDTLPGFAIHLTLSLGCFPPSPPSLSSTASAAPLPSRLGAPELRVRCVITPDAVGLPPCLPRVGLTLRVPPALGACVEWLGRGPWECYPDRLASAFVGRHVSTADEMEEKSLYLVPGESGGRADVRWAALRRESPRGSGLLVCTPLVAHAPAPPSASSAIAASAFTAAAAAVSSVSSRRPHPPLALLTLSRHAPAAVAAARHPHELPRPSPWLEVTADAAHCGLGGDDSWSVSVHDDHRVRPGAAYVVDLRVRPLGGSEDGDAIFREG